MRKTLQAAIARLRHRGFARRCSSDRGASLVEYALLIALIAIVCIVAVTFFGGSASESFSESSSSLFVS